jgi:sec-independent protein translocase protein TatA
MLSGLENPVHLAFLALIALLIFGPKRLPQIGRSLGSGIREFKDSLTHKEAEPESKPDSLPPSAEGKPRSTAG